VDLEKEAELPEMKVSENYYEDLEEFATFMQINMNGCHLGNF
jgi:hypothetical protein